MQDSHLEEAAKRNLALVDYKHKNQPTYSCIADFAKGIPIRASSSGVGCSTCGHFHATDFSAFLISEMAR